jgi:DNA mismatch endonuclease (patch repair protein)
MSRIGPRDTVPERAVRSFLHRLGYRFRLHARELPGSPDITLPKWRKVIFVHGCFWHRHPGCKFAYNPKSRVHFWQEKFAGNVARDRRNVAALRTLGWHAHIIWECETQDSTALLKRLRQIFRA